MFKFFNIIFTKTLFVQVSICPTVLTLTYPLFYKNNLRFLDKITGFFSHFCTLLWTWITLFFTIYHAVIHFTKLKINKIQYINILTFLSVKLHVWELYKWQQYAFSRCIVTSGTVLWYLRHNQLTVQMKSAFVYIFR